MYGRNPTPLGRWFIPSLSHDLQFFIVTKGQELLLWIMILIDGWAKKGSWKTCWGFWIPIESQIKANIKQDWIRLIEFEINWNNVMCHQTKDARLTAKFNLDIMPNYSEINIYILCNQFQNVPPWGLQDFKIYYIFLYFISKNVYIIKNN